MFIDHRVNSIQLAQNLICVLRVQRIYNSMVSFSKYVTMLIFLKEVVTLIL